MVALGRQPARNEVSWAGSATANAVVVEENWFTQLVWVRAASLAAT